MIKFRVCSTTTVLPKECNLSTSCGNIQKVDVIRETDQFVVFSNGRAEEKNSGFIAYYDTYEDAKNHAVARFQKEIEAAEYKLNVLKKQCQVMSNVKEPLRVVSKPTGAHYWKKKTLEKYGLK
jgi:hypothetical protein